MRSILLLGGGGHCHSCIEAIESSGEWSISCIVDKSLNQGDTVLGYPVLYDNGDLSQFIGQVDCALVTIGQIKSSQLRKVLYERMVRSGLEPAVVIASTAYVSRNAHIGKGTVALHHTLVNAGAIIGENCIINTGAIVEHDSQIGCNCHISTGAVINGSCQVGNDVFIGSRTVVIQGVSIEPGVVIGAGSVVVRNLVEPGHYVGCPARRISDETK